MGVAAWNHWLWVRQVDGAHTAFEIIDVAGTGLADGLAVSGEQ
jgi:hypothetical protein